jgi:hypothetical protein
MERQGTGLNILAVFRSVLNCNGFDWKQCEEIVAGIALMVEEAAWLETDTGRTFDLAFVPKKG